MGKIFSIFSLTNLTLVTALSLSGIAAWYSIAGLVAIFSAAVIPIIIMGSALEFSKVVTTVWLHRYWKQIKFGMRLYLVIAVISLAFLTSMGIFGFLSKAHSDQNLVSGDVQSKIAIYDEKIKTAKENIEANRKQLKQMDEAVDQVMGRSTDEKGADKAVAIRKSQQRDRAALAKDIEANQKLIATLNDEAAPIRAEVRKVEAEVGPIKYIAALIYGDNPDANLLERAVRWVIILIVLVFDPLALTLVLAANSSREWDNENYKPDAWVADVTMPEPGPGYEPDDGPLTEEQIEQIVESTPENIEEKEESIYEKYPYLKKPWKSRVNGFHVGPQVYKPESDVVPEPEVVTEQTIEEPTADSTEIVTEGVTEEKPVRDLGDGYVVYDGKTFNREALKQLNPELFSIKADQKEITTNFGTEFPKLSNKGDVFVRVDALPNRVYKFDGRKWIEINKNLTNSYLYDQEYVKYLVNKISSGEYDIELLSDNERSQIETYLKNQNG